MAEEKTDIAKEKQTTQEQHEEVDKKQNEKSEKNEDRITQLESKVRDAEEQVKRYLADYQNLQRRVQEEKYQWIRSANKELLLKLLPVLDTLMLAQKHVNDKGLALSIDQFLKILEAEGVEQIKTVGERFDPKTMEAIGTAEGKKDIIVEEAKAGFTLYDSILRGAQVIVGK